MEKKLTLKSKPLKGRERCRITYTYGSSIEVTTRRCGLGLPKDLDSRVKAH
jgi:hypothetical protein